MRIALLLALATIALPLPAFGQDGKAPNAPAKDEKEEQAAEEAEPKVREILESFRGQNTYHSDERRVVRIVAMGRAAVPTLMRFLREEYARGTQSGFHVDAARDALARLVEQRDFADLAELLADGVLEASKGIIGLEHPKLIEALLVPIRKGFVDYEYVDDLAKFGTEKEVRAAFVEWLEKFGRGGTHGCAYIAKAVGRLSIKEAIPAMKKIAASRSCESYPRVEIGKALTTMGEKAGVAILLDELDPDDEPGRNHHNRHEAGDALNRVVGEKWYIGRHGPDEDEGNFDEAVPKFKEWWKKAEATLRWDEKKLKWVW